MSRNNRGIRSTEEAALFVLYLYCRNVTPVLGVGPADPDTQPEPAAAAQRQRGQYHQYGHAAADG